MICRTDARAVALCAALVLAATGACPAPPRAPNPVPVQVRAPAAVLDLRVADTEATREYGLMCVRALPAHAGMIFVFGDGDARRSFWMKNTLVSLDMVFILKNGRVNNVDANVPATQVGTPDDRLQNYYGTGAYVIELGAGEAARDGLRPGTVLDLSAVGPSKD